MRYFQVMPNQSSVLERPLLDQPTNYSLPQYGGPSPPLQQQPPTVENLVVHGSTPLSQIGANICPAPPSESSGGPLSPAPTTPGGSADDCDSDFTSRSGRKQKRGVLPKHATSVMRSWLFQHLVVSVFLISWLQIWSISLWLKIFPISITAYLKIENTASLFFEMA